MSTDRVKLSMKDDGIASIKLQSDDGKNWLDSQFLQQLEMVVNEIKTNQNIKVVILEGEKEYFSAGANQEFVAELAQHYENNLEHTYARKASLITEIPVPVIANMKGSAIGGGLTLGCHADMMFMAQESRYGFTFMNMAFTPGMSTTVLAKEWFGFGLSNELMLTGDLYKGSHFIGKSSVNGVVPRATIDDEVYKVALAIAEKPRMALEMLKKHLSSSRLQRIESNFLHESMMHKLCFANNLIDYGS